MKTSYNYNNNSHKINLNILTFVIILPAISNEDACVDHEITFGALIEFEIHNREKNQKLNIFFKILHVL